MENKNEMIEILRELKSQNFKKIFIQIAEGLKSEIEKIKNEFEKEGFEVIFSLEPTYGACDVRDDEAKRFGCDAIVHIGHANFGVKTSLPTFYIHWIFEPKEDFKDLLEKNKEKFIHNSYALVSSLQYVKYLKILKEFLESLGKKVYTKKVLEYEGQILGCNVSAARVSEAEAIIIISEGFFYPLGLLIEIKDKPIIYIDIEKNEIKDISELRKKYEKIIAWNLIKFKEAKKVGILVSWKKGQIFFDVFKVKKELESLGKEVYIFAFDEILPEKLEGINVDFLVNVACPRIFPDDLERYKIPILNYSIIKQSIYEEKNRANNI
ncbi:MAG: diphthamide biosynthesis enzyme Dph2 [Candidatus Aenigmatarchaeota archaeon]